ncbi:MAG: SpoVA/SpoVAEb family sporulation membrane protein [Ruminococcaceae bacterium]|nr:SpoVA/SpoVAEb family sporulation membrane protein [Oscillospiraceae bacterium]
MSPKKSQYQRQIDQTVPRSPKVKNGLWAFMVGGSLCTLGEGLYQWMTLSGMEQKTARTLASCGLILLAAVLTLLQVFDNLAKRAGAGTLVPITGFANAVVSPAIEFKTEGYVLGVGAKMFTIAGPVIVYGTVASVVYGVIYWLWQTL